MSSFETYKRKEIFKISNSIEFEKAAIEVFHFQFTHNFVYNQYVNLLQINPEKVSSIEHIPFLPIELYKTQKIIVKNIEAESLVANARQPIVFKSSGTTSSQRSNHFVSDISLYQESFTKGFEYFYGNPKDYCFLALLPSYQEAGNSSLIYMVDSFISQSKSRFSGYYLHDDIKLVDAIDALRNEKVKTIFIGVSYALLDFAETHKIKLPKNILVMETGGMKGRKSEMTREELHLTLCKAFGVNKIHSEYGMTELLSQAYSKGNGKFTCPPWMKVLLRDVNDPLTIQNNNKTGAINIIDLANIYSCSFIATQDLGRKLRNNIFEVLGRFDESDIRGCNLLINNV